MATACHTVVPAAVAVDSKLDPKLARRAAALLVRMQPHKKSKEVACELRRQLKKEKRERDSAGLNHWKEHAPQFLARIVRQARQDRLRRCRETEALYQDKHAHIVRVARLIVNDPAGAEAVAAETYRELLLGITTLAGFFTALICNARNYLAADPYREGKLLSLEEAFAPGHGSADDPNEDGAGLQLEPMSHHREDQDPLDILIAREDAEENQRMIQQAKRIARQDWRYCWIGQKKWGRELGIGTARTRMS